jgi:hypothetical protein
MERSIEASRYAAVGRPWLAGHVRASAARALALVDLSPLSPTFGCADRAFWYYRTITDFYGATWQQAMLGFAALHLLDSGGGDAQWATVWRDAAAAMLGWWARRQHRDGSFDEWYRNERSYCPTAITAAGAALTMHLLGDDLPNDTRQLALSSLERAGHWLEPRYNAAVMNQNLAAAVALQGLAGLTGEERWRGAAQARLERVSRAQDAEGWFLEYGGADLGYSTLALDFLAASHLLGAEQARPMARRLAAFLGAVQGCGPGLPGRLGSRGTAHMFPFGALYFAADDAGAAMLARRWLEALEAGHGPDLRIVDDRYFAYFYFPQFALAALWLERSRASAIPPAAVRTEPATDLPGSGFIVQRRADMSLTVSRRLGGALAIQTADAPPVYHLGYEIVAGGRRYSSAVWSDAPVHAVACAAIAATAEFQATASGVPLERLMVPFQIAVRTLATSRLAGMFQESVKARMIAPRRPLPLRLDRDIRLEGDAVVVTDRLVLGAGLEAVERLAVAGQISMHSPSARQDRAAVVGFPDAVLGEARKRLAAGSAVEIRWRCPAGEQAASVEVRDG